MSAVGEITELVRQLAKTQAALREALQSWQGMLTQGRICVSCGALLWPQDPLEYPHDHDEDCRWAALLELAGEEP